MSSNSEIPLGIKAIYLACCMYKKLTYGIHYTKLNFHQSWSICLYIFLLNVYETGASRVLES